MMDVPRNQIYGKIEQLEAQRIGDDLITLWPCTCGEYLRVTIVEDADGVMRTKQVQHGDNPEHSATCEQLRERYGETAVWAHKTYRPWGGPDTYDAGGPWLDDVHARMRFCE
jgi:hypothetical protein